MSHPGQLTHSLSDNHNQGKEEEEEAGSEPPLGRQRRRAIQERLISTSRQVPCISE
jgi:hypothetical protein